MRGVARCITSERIGFQGKVFGLVAGGGGEGAIGRLAPTHYSFMGFQGYPHDTSAWVETYAAQVIAQLKEEGVDCVLLTPA